MNKKLCKKFCWLPTPVYSSPHYRDGFRWMSNVWVGAGGKCYTTELEAAVSKANQGRRIDACLKAFEGIPTEEFEGMTVAEYVCRETFIKNVEATNSGVELSMSGIACQMLAHAFAGQFTGTHPDGGKGNYVEFTFSHPETGELTVTMQRKAGKTPGQKVAELECQRDELLEVAKGALKEIEATMLAEGVLFGDDDEIPEKLKAVIARIEGGAP